MVAFPTQAASFFPFSFFSSTFTIQEIQIHQQHHCHHSNNGLSQPPSFRPLVPTGKIFSPQNQPSNSTLHTPSALLTDDLKYSTAFSNSSSFLPTATIYQNPFYTTASQSTTWHPLTPNSGQTASQASQISPPHQSPQSDFVLYPQARRSFEASPNARVVPSNSNSQALSGTIRRHSAHLPSVSTPQNQRVAAIIQGTGHSTTTPAFTNNRYTSAQNQFYASSAPSSSVALQSQQPRSRPPVPLFAQSTGNIHTKQMFQTTPMAQGTFQSSHAHSQNSQYTTDMDLFDDDFPSFVDDGTTTGLFQPYNSPAVPTTYDLTMVRSTSSSTNVGTVSPHDLMVRDPTFSAPNSTAFTNLTSPSLYNESPALDDAFTSPMFQDSDMSGDPWFPLFPDANNTNHNVGQSPAEQSPLQPAEELEVSEHLRMERRRSGNSPGSGKASSTSGVAARKRNQPLPPIVVEDPNDTIAMKRARNTLAARKSRQKKMERFDELEAEIAKLKEDRDYWKNLALAKTSAE